MDWQKLSRERWSLCTPSVAKEYQVIPLPEDDSDSRVTFLHGNRIKSRERTKLERELSFQLGGEVVVKTLDECSVDESEFNDVFTQLYGEIQFPPIVSRPISDRIIDIILLAPEEDEYLTSAINSQLVAASARIQFVGSIGDALKALRSLASAVTLVLIPYNMSHDNHLDKLLASARKLVSQGRCVEIAKLLLDGPRTEDLGSDGLATVSVRNLGNYVASLEQKV